MLAASASAPKAPISGAAGTTPAATFSATSPSTTSPKPAMSRLFPNAAPARQRTVRFSAYRLRAYTDASPNMSNESALSAVKRASSLAPNSATNMTALMASTTHSTRPKASRACSIPWAFPSQQSSIVASTPCTGTLPAPPLP